ncbi:ApaG protein [Citrobacter koseri]|uniref:ApaG protein n=1 Tax=Citrobacter koseri TaxID=545 RepID=A0A447UR69_CITKO|nr:ApaG protein [Citrobacter koseri]
MINSPRVCIQVQSVYIEAQSSPDDERYVFAYTVTIRNLGRAPVQLLGRYWLITNGHGRETEVQGEGVVGVQPHIAPEKSTSTPAALLLKRRWAPCRVTTK